MTVLPELSFQEISQYFHLPISQAAKELKVCETLLKKICRVNGIKRWPHRKIRSIDTMINLLEFRIQSEKLSEKEKNRMRNEILDLAEKKTFFMASPNTTYQSIIPKNTLQSFSKTKLKNQKSFSLFLHEEAKKPQKNNKKKEISEKNVNNINSDDNEIENTSPVDNDDDGVMRNGGQKKLKGNNKNLEEEEEEVLNVLYSLAKEKQKEHENISIEEVNKNNNDGNVNFVNSGDNVNNNQEKYPNELYKLSLIAILNPINEEDDNNNDNNDDNNKKENDKVKELKMRNILRRSLENFDIHSHNNIKKRKLDFVEYQSDIEVFPSASSSDDRSVPRLRSHFIHTTKMIK